MARPVGWVLSLMVAVGVSSAASVSAQAHEAALPFSTVLGPGWPRGQVAGGLAFHSQDDFNVFTLDLGAWGRVTPGFALEGLLGTAHVSGAGGDSTVTNPWLAGYYVHASRSVLARIGMGISPPIADENLAFILVWFAWGVRDVWRLAPRHLGFVPTFRVDGLAGDDALWGVDGDFAILVPTGSGLDTELMLQGGGDIAARLVPALHLGLRLQGGWWATETSGDARLAQLSLVPFVRVLFGAGFAELRFLINVDEPAGLSFDDGKLWLLTLRGGSRF